MSTTTEIVRTTDLRFVELDGRQSGEIYYQLICNLGAHVLALLAREGKGKSRFTRAVPIPCDKGNDAMTHPESPDYLGGDQVIYGGGYEDLIVDFEAA